MKKLSTEPKIYSSLDDAWKVIRELNDSGEGMDDAWKFKVVLVSNKGWAIQVWDENNEWVGFWTEG